METRPPLPMPGHSGAFKKHSKAPSDGRSLHREISPSGSMLVTEEVCAPAVPGASMAQEPQQTDFQLVRVKSTWSRIKKGEALSNSEDEITHSEAKM